MRNFKLTLASTIAGLALITAQSAQANELTNPGFEQDVGTYANGNNFPGTVVGWTFGSGQNPNVVKVDGAGGYDYGNNGPEFDADAATGPGVSQHYLDIADGSNSFYQSFTPSCSGNVNFGGSFSSRANRRGSATIAIREGDGLTGTVVGVTESISTPYGNSKTTPWTDVSYSTTLSAGTTYSFVITMDNDANFDDGFVEFDDCPGDEEINLCCPPWTKTKMSASLQPVAGPGGLGSNFAINYQSVAASDNAMEAYVSYLSVVNPAVSTLDVRYHTRNFGTAALPSGPSSPVPGATSQTVIHSPVSTSAPTFWPGFIFQQDIWYGFMTQVTARDMTGTDLELFDKVNSQGERVCPNIIMYYRVQSIGTNSQPGFTNSGEIMVEVSDGDRIVANVPLSSLTESLNYEDTPAIQVPPQTQTTSPFKR